MARDKPTLYKHPNSRWWYISWYTDGGRKTGSLKLLGLSVDDYSKDEALEKYLQHIGELPAEPEPGAETIGWLKDKLLKIIDTSNSVQKSTLKEYRLALEHLENYFGVSYAISSIRQMEVYNFQEYLLKIGHKPMTANKTLRHVRGALNKAVKFEIIDKNYFQGFTPVNIDKKNNEPSHLTPDQLARFLAVVNDSKLAYPKRGKPEYFEGIKRIVYLCVALGIRRKEALYIRRDDVSLTTNRIRVMNVKSKNHPKRWLTIPQSIHPDVEFILDTFPGDNPFCVCHPDTLTHRVKRWLREAELPESLHLHSLRHTFATMALKAGESSWRIKDHLGHSSIKLLENTYSHTDVDDGIAINIGIDLNKLRNSEQTR